MPTSPDLTSARNLAYQGVGRNLLRFQRFELVLKYLVGLHQGAYTIETMDEDMKRRLEAQERKTLGLLAGDLFAKVIMKQDNDDFVAADGENSGKFTHRFGITITEEIHKEWQSRLKSLVDERNELVHLSLLKWNLDSVEGCQAVVAELDEQFRRIVTVLDQIKHYYELFTKSMKLLHEEMIAADDPEEGASQ